MTIQIEKGVPFPPNNRGNRYPFKEMEVGDSFVALLSDSRSPDMARFQGSLIRSAKYAIGPGKITTCRLPDGTGFRVWRIA